MDSQPIAVALLLCEQVIVDDRTRRVTPVNCSTRWRVHGPLTAKQTFYAVAVLSNGRGSIPARLEIERLDSAVSIFRREFTVAFRDPLHQPSCLLRVRHLVFPVAGAYQAMLWVGDDCLMLRRFVVAHEEETT